MLPLSELQRAFADAMAEGTSQAATAVMAKDGRALRSVALYRRLIRNNYHQVLKITYPVLHRFVGDSYFSILARGYLKRYPSASGDLFLYGRHLPALLQRSEAPPILVELARLEWACHELYQAPDSTPLSLDHLQTMMSADPLRATIRFQPTARFLSFPIPIHRVWLALQPEAPSDIDVDLPLPEEQTGVVVTRNNGTVQVTSLVWSQYRLLEALSQGTDVAAVERVAKEAGAGCDVTRLMTILLNLHVIAGVTVKEDS